MNKTFLFLSGSRLIYYILVFILVLLARISSSNDIALSLLTSTRSTERILENNRILLTCIATKNTESNESEDSDDTLDWADIEVIIRHNDTETVRALYSIVQDIKFNKSFVLTMTSSTRRKDECSDCSVQYSYKYSNSNKIIFLLFHRCATVTVPICVQHFFRATRMHCVRGACSAGPRNKICEYELRRVTLAANGTGVTCAIGTQRSQKFALNVTGKIVQLSNSISLQVKLCTMLNILEEN